MFHLYLQKLSQQIDM